MALTRFGCLVAMCSRIAAYCDSLAFADSQVIGQRKHVRRLLMPGWSRQTAGAAVAKQVGTMSWNRVPHSVADGIQSWLEPEKPCSSMSGSPAPWNSK